MRKKVERRIDLKLIEAYSIYLREQEKSESTIKKYIHDINLFMVYSKEKDITKIDVIKWKEHLLETYAPISINTMIAAINSLFEYCKWDEIKIKPLKIQKNMFCDERKELTRAEYGRLISVANREGNKRLSLVIQTICATGIRVSELKFITVESVFVGKAEVNNKGKIRMVFLTNQLQCLLKKYIARNKIKGGSIFTTKNGKPLDRSNIWRDMKRLCRNAHVEEIRVFPHNLRHLFARTFYSVVKDISRLADILGHSNINTTRIYTIESGEIHAKQINKLNLVFR